MQQRSREQDEKGLAPLVQRTPALLFIEASEQFGILCTAIRDRRQNARDPFIPAVAVLVADQAADFRDDPSFKLENQVEI